MKRTFLLAFLFLFLSFSAQEKICYNENWIEVKCSAEYTFYRILQQNKNGLYPVKDYYKNGVLQMEGAYSDKNYRYKEGEFVYYYENGKLSSVENYSNNALLGYFKKMYPNGQKNYEGTYLEPDGPGLYWNYWLEDGTQKVTNGNGYYEKKSDDGSFSEGNLKQGKADGLWKGYMKERNIRYEEVYENDELLHGKSVQDGKTYMYNVIEEFPHPVKGDDDLRNYISEKFRFPGKVLRKDYSASFIIALTIDEKGQLSNVEPENIVDEKVKTRLIDIIKKYPGKFKIPKIRGVPSKQRIRIPFTLIVD